MGSEYQYFLAQFVDIHGRAKAKMVPAKHREMIFSPGAGFAGFAITGLGMQPNDQEFMAVGDQEMIRPVSWMKNVASITCDGHVSGRPHPLDSRVIAKKALADFRAETGLVFYTGLEPEFFLLRHDGEGGYQVATQTEALDKPCYDFANLSAVSDFLMELQEALAIADIDVYQIDHEDANGQFEVNFTYADGLKSADNVTFFKMAASAIAKKHDMLCSFMPKPFSDRSGSGLHLHMSAGNDMGNAFEDSSDANGLSLSKLAYQFLGGLVAHAEALTAIAAPTVNSYRRLVAGGSRSGSTWAPVFIAYGNNNRTAFVRVPGGRLELRVSDAASNPYLLTAAVIYAGLDGIRRNLHPGEPQNGNLYALSPQQISERNIRMLPRTLLESLTALQGDAVLCTGLGMDFVNEFCELKTQEWYDMTSKISSAEFKHYVDFF